MEEKGVGEKRDKTERRVKTIGPTRKVKLRRKES